MDSWQVQDAKARFREFLDATIKRGFQVVTRRGIETAVLVPIGEWNRLQKAARPSLKVLLLAPGARFEEIAAAHCTGDQMNRYLLDTNVVSELRKPRGHGGVVACLNHQKEDQLFLSAVTMAELQTGIERTRSQDPSKANDIESWADQLAASFQILPMDTRCFREWGTNHRPKTRWIA